MVTAILVYLKEINVWRLVSGTAMDVWFSLVGGPTTVNRMAVTALHHIMNPFLLTVDIFALIFVFMLYVWIICYNDDCLGYQLA